MDLVGLVAAVGVVLRAFVVVAFVAGRAFRTGVVFSPDVRGEFGDDPHRDGDTEVGGEQTHPDFGGERPEERE